MLACMDGEPGTTAPPAEPQRDDSAERAAAAADRSEAAASRSEGHANTAQSIADRLESAAGRIEAAMTPKADPKPAAPAKPAAPPEPVKADSQPKPKEHWSERRMFARRTQKA